MSKHLWAGGDRLHDLTGNPSDHVPVPAAMCRRVVARLDHLLAAGTDQAEYLEMLRRWFDQYGDGMPLGYECWQLPAVDMSDYTPAHWDRLDAEASRQMLELADVLQHVIDGWPGCWHKDYICLEAVVRGLRHVAEFPQHMLTIY